MVVLWFPANQNVGTFSPPIKGRLRIYRFSVLSNFKMQVRARGAAGMAHQGNRIAGLDAIAFLHG
jgi:hypothetical protein